MVTAAKCYELEAWKIGSGEHLSMGLSGLTSLKAKLAQGG
jgi:hypothetical protein